MNQPLTYDAAAQELEQLVASLETDEPIGMEEYVAKARRANQLIRFCRERLTSIDDELKKIFEEDAEGE